MKNFKFFIVFAVFLFNQFLPSFAQAQSAATPNPEPFASSIRVADLQAHLRVLTADSLEGRETGTVGNQKAAEYIARYFESLGLPKVGENNSYFQKMVYTSQSWNRIGLEIGDEAYRHYFNFVASPATNPELGAQSFYDLEVVFLGYGIDDAAYSDYKKHGDVRGKIILILGGEPLGKSGKAYINSKMDSTEWALDITKKLRTAHKYGARAVLVIDENLAQNIAEGKRRVYYNGVGDVQPTSDLAPNLFISPDIAKQIIGEKKADFKKAREKCQKGKPRSVALPCKISIQHDKFFKQLVGNNVMGFIEGSDPVLKNEIVVVSAHYDHLGKRGKSIYHGADDNGSGSSSVLDICAAFTEAKKQGKGARRSVLCLLVTGEEKGLLGSNFYVKNPIFPLENTVADINIDMIGRVDEKHADGPNYIYVIGADKLSTDLHKINEAANKQFTKLALDYTYNDENDPNRYYYRSDHYNFAEKGIPAIFYFNGTHEDYHQPSDTFEKINFEKMAKIAQLAFYTTWEIANRPERLKVDVKQK
jgi:hypothetical protein